MGIGLLMADALSILIALGLTWLLRSWILGPLKVADELNFVPIFLLYCALNVMQGLYEPLGIPVEEQIRRIVVDVFFVGSFMTALFFAAKAGSTQSRSFFYGFWAAQVLSGPLTRILCRRIMQALGIWGLPVGLLAKTVDDLNVAVDYLQAHPEAGLRPVIGCAEDAPSEANAVPAKIPLLPETAFQQTLQEQHFTTLVILGEAAETLLKKRKVYRSYVSTIVALDRPGTLSELCGVQFSQYGSYYGLSMSHPLLRRRGQWTKRLADVVLCGAGLILISPLFLLLMLLIRLDSPGPAFYVQKRRGKGGKTFGMIKFRTMVDGADLKLRDYLEANPAAKAEWDAYQKLSNDPRVTRMGRFLRRTSLDELPQLINILKGEMSLVGPRPIVIGAAVEQYGPGIAYADLVLPGLTGLWQVSGRNDCTIEEHAAMDYQYIMTWSIWKDVCILFQTIPAVLHGETS